MKRRKQKIAGFTMIELLIVIAVLGVLAVAVLSAINPIEQINRGRDTGSRSDAEQLLSAIDRYNAVQGKFPWQESTGQDVNEGGPDVAWGEVSSDILDELEATEEIKPAFSTRLQSSNYNDIYLYYNDEIAGASVYACFKPQSKAFQAEAANDCDTGEGGVGKPNNEDFPEEACVTTDGSIDKDNFICIP